MHIPYVGVKNGRKEPCRLKLCFVFGSFFFVLKNTPIYGQAVFKSIGQLQPGLHLSGNVISGTATTAGSFDVFTARVTDLPAIQHCDQ